MASEDGPPPTFLAPPAVTALREEAAKDGGERGHMERTISMDIREEREELKKAAEQSTNAILELALDGTVRWVSPSWPDVAGITVEETIGKPIAELLVENCNVFGECIEAMRRDDSKSRTVRFSVKTALPIVRDDSASFDDKTPVEPKSGFDPLPQAHSTSEALHIQGTEQSQSAEQQEKPQPLQARHSESGDVVDLEAQGIMIYDRTTGEESHTMWMVKPAVSREVTIDLPELLVESLGVGAEMLANYLTLLAEVGSEDPEHHPPPMPVLCRICERSIQPWWFEKHTELCSQEHRAEMEVQLAQEALNEQRSALVKVLDALEAQTRLTRSLSNDSSSPTPAPKAEYKGLPIGPTSTPSSGPSSGRSSPAMQPSRSRESSATGLSHHRARSFAVRRPLARIVELVLDLCDTAMEISTPSIKENKVYASYELRTQSPQSEGRIQQVLQWQSPSQGTLENEQGLALLCEETAQLARSKVEAVFRHRRILEYSERIRVEFDILVHECVAEATLKAARIKAGDMSDSSDESPTYETPEEHADPSQEEASQEPPLQSTEEIAPEEPSIDDEVNVVPKRFTGSPSAMAMALRSASELTLDRRASSTGSSRASSPGVGATTPKSSVGPPEPFASFALHKRGSLAFESDAGGDSDSSMRSSHHSGGHRRADSPNAEVALSRVVSHRSRERKRQSLVLPSLIGQARHPSPGRGQGTPSSPLRMAKPRMPSSAVDSIPSPVTSPTLPTEGFTSPIIRAQHQSHHRRQSSNALADVLARPTSPRLSGVMGNSQAGARQTSIKDFEIIKPISKGAFGSVYLSKKKTTGDYFAIKVLKKADMIAKNQVTNVKAERAIMMWQGESDFVAKLYWTFSSKDYLYLVMEYLNGGDCASLIKVLGALPEDWTKKYIGEVVLCVQHLHSRQIVHRDIKPDNLLIDAKGHLKLTDFGLSRMGLIGRQKRAINAKPEDAPPDLLKAGPFRRAPSVTSSRSTSFDYHGHHSPAQTPAMTPALAGDLSQPSYFSLNREASREPSRRTSGHRSNSGDSDALESMFRRFSMADSRTPIEEETASEEGGESPDPYILQPVPSNVGPPKTETPPAQNATMPPPIMSLFDPTDSDRRFVGTPDYLAPETINGAGQDEMSDWWSLGCVLFECLYGRPPFNADTPEGVFKNILARNIQWPCDDEDVYVSEEAKDLMNKLMCSDPKERLGSNKEEKYADGGEEIKAHPWFSDINWETLREDEASFVPTNENPEDTEYFDPRGASMQHFAPEFQDEQNSPLQTPGADYPDRPHDALSRVRSQVNAVKRNLMPLHIPPHVRDARSRRLSEPVVNDDFGSFQFKNLPVLEKANKDVIQKLRADAMQAQAKSALGLGTSSPAVVSPSPAPSLDASPILPMPLKRTLSANKGHNRPQSPSMLSHHSSSPSRGSQPSSPLLVHFSAGQRPERRKASSGSSHLSQQTSNTSLQPGNFFEQVPRFTAKSQSAAPSPVRSAKNGSMQLHFNGETGGKQQRATSVSSSSPRQRSHTVGSQEGDLVPELVPAHHKRRSGVFDVSPFSSDNEESRQKPLRFQRNRQSSNRMSQVNLTDGPMFRTLDVLVCEDHPVSRLVMERLLEKLRCRTIIANNGAEAVRYATSTVKFDIIMMEYKLPQVNGVDVARMIRETKNANSNTPIVAVTGYLKELGVTHNFNALIEKPPTKEKLENVMSSLCQWKPAPEGWKPTPPMPVPAAVRQDSIPISTTDDSPTTTSSLSGFTSNTNTGREWSISSIDGAESHAGSIGSMGSIPLIVSRQPTLDEDYERNFGSSLAGGLGITQKPLVASPEPDVSKQLSRPFPQLLHESSAPARLDTPPSPVLRRQPSAEAVEAKRRSLEKVRHESAAESGDDEDEELGQVNVSRQRSPKRGTAKRASKLGTEMLRTNSQGSVISVDDVVAVQSAARASAAETPTTHAIAEDPAAEVEAMGHLTPPEIFTPSQAGDQTKEVMMEITTPMTEIQPDLEATPRPHHTHEPDPDPTPRASTSPTHHD
ncbi:hypothetical protein BAUCODRAFT_246511 [Baudoinia panamericana UAMH 10762]|uniref:non-specific serine/threonine protein kinase n=1 Tax=Baudoinia panamericana (strain UAMH 10762) TaxID=717646 RepID=M2LHF8_BAUPA|nr:uncharacterized protein BAUCODRAFT_246511 [Baudoinia panamericana UAMH 10762]EMC93597.1 hypothetical protein BAUCODRAFT_246511 [Baudoinia panamericana UAMH 10762]